MNVPNFGHFGQRSLENKFKYPGNSPEITQEELNMDIGGGLVPGRDNDSDETEGHVQSADVSKSVEVPAGKWADVRRGQMVVEGCYVDSEGFLRYKENNAYAAWHDSKCPIKKVTKEEIVFDTNGAPWCPSCYEKLEQEREAKKIRGIFAQGHTDGSGAEINIPVN